MTEPTNKHELSEDRILDRALNEVIGNETPPDLSAQILKKLPNENLTQKELVMSNANQEQSSFSWKSFAVAASLLLALGGISYALFSPAMQTPQESGKRLAANDLPAKQSESALKDGGKEVVVVEEITEEDGELGPEVEKFHKAAITANGGATTKNSGTAGEGKPNQAGKRVESKALGDLIQSTVKPESWYFENGSEQRLQSSNGSTNGVSPGLVPPRQGISLYNIGGRIAPGGIKEIKIGQGKLNTNGDGANPVDVTLHLRYDTGKDASVWSFVTDARVRALDDDRDGNLNYDDFVSNLRRVSGDKYERIFENPFLPANENPLSTFSIDVDTASYANMRQFISGGQLPPQDAIRIEELVNYFGYDYEAPTAESADPFKANMEVTACPWAPTHRLLRVGLKGKEIANDKRPASNLVFLVDVSGSMSSSKKLPLVVSGLKTLAEHLGENDRVAIVVYASAQGLVLNSTPGTQRYKIIEALDKLNAGGSTNGGAGIQLAYKLAEKNFIKNATNRVILCTDGDFNVGTTSNGDLERLVEQKAKSGVFLTVLGFGRGNLNDQMMEKISNIGNGNYHYIDGPTEARKVLVEEMGGTLVTIAKDVKIQIEFNPKVIAGYRLIGYENRMLAKEDFNDDKKDAGEIGAGHTVTALYELIPTDVLEAAIKERTSKLTKRIKEIEVLVKSDVTKKELKEYETELAALKKAVEAIRTAGTSTKAKPGTKTVDPLKYQSKPELSDAAATGELLTLKLRYKEPTGDKSKLLEFPVTDDGKPFAKASKDTQFAASVAMFGMLLRNSQYRGTTTLDNVLEIASASASASKDDSEKKYRDEFVELVRKAKQMAGK